MAHSATKEERIELLKLALSIYDHLKLGDDMGAVRLLRDFHEGAYNEGYEDGKFDPIVRGGKV
jgi:hypothetical protein